MNPGVLTALRDFVPIRPLTRTEAYRIAELQASRFLKLVNVNEAPISEHSITELPRLQVQRFSPLPVSGATQWANGKWMILLNLDPREGCRLRGGHSCGDGASREPFV